MPFFMKPHEILNITAHRPDPLPDRPWSAYQVWKNVVFLHWRVDRDLLTPYIPRHQAVKLDVFDNSAWVSLVGFQVRHARIRYLPPLPFMARFDELNFRTYIREHKRPAVVFLDIGASRLLPVLLSRALGLPYRLADLCANEQSFLLQDKPGKLDISWRSEPDLISKQLQDKWLTDRYYAVQQLGIGVCRYPIHHPSWQLQKVELQKAEGNYEWDDIRLSMDSVEIAHYASRVEALLWTPRRLKDFQK